jgi:uncharacterized protein
MRTKALFSAMLLALAPLPIVAQDFNAGLAAAERGDYVAALREWKPLAEQGHAGAQNNLGVIYEHGHSVAQDRAAAARLFRLAAEQGYARAQSNLGVMYEQGHGVAQDYAEAVRWYRLAAEQGIDHAQYFLGLMYGKGQGVAKDDVLAHMWINIAAANGIKNAVEARDILDPMMTSTDLSESQRRARVCMESNYQDCD